MAWNEPEDEADYLESLEHERHMYAWCLTRYSGLSPEAAAREAMSFYEYQPASYEYRGLVFHDVAWHWAMLRIRGDCYWLSDRGLETPSVEYQAESEAYCARRQTKASGGESG